MSTLYRVKVQLVLIKKPTRQEREKLKSSRGGKIPRGRKILINETLDLQDVFNRHVKETVDEDDPGIVNMTMTKHFFERSLEKTAQRAADYFKELVLNVF